MSFAVVHTRAQAGVDAPLVSVETHLSNGLPGLSIVGLPETAVKESKDRVRAALLNSRFEFPARRITINLAPADLPKHGSRFDLAIALGILAASGQIPTESLEKFEFLGELALNGSLRQVPGALPMAIQTRAANRSLVAPTRNSVEAALVSGLNVFAAEHLLEVCAHLHGQQALTEAIPKIDTDDVDNTLDLVDVRAQYHAKRALEVAAAGAHSLLLFGPPGTGKSMLANRLLGILPPMTEDEALESAAVRSVSGIDLAAANWQQRPFRAPHHTASGVALVGGGSRPRPGEISLAHHGVLFLDELPEFDRRVLEVLREPLESGRITISRAALQADFPACFQLIAAMNPCPCGYLGHSNGRCRCTPEQVLRYRGRISGPLLDRIDMHVEVPPLPRDAFANNKERTEVSSKTIRERVTAARQRQLARCGVANNALNHKQISTTCSINDEDAELVHTAIERLGLSVRAYHRILKVARTIADLANDSNIGTAHLTEALSYRQMDRPPAG